jgi:long-chain acyl-CoA synthetase
MSAEGLLANSFAALPDLIRAHAAERPDHPALAEGDATLTYAGLSALMDRIAFALQREGVRNGDAVAICARTSINYAAAFCGVLAAGAAVAPLAPSSTPASLLMMLKDCGARIFLLDRETAEILRGAGYEHGFKRVALDDSEAGEPFSRWLGPEGAPPAKVVIAPDHPFNIIYSSGTTGAPKGIVQPHRMRFGQFVRISYKGAVTIVSTPLYSNTTLVVFLPTLAHGRADAQVRRRRIPSPLAGAPSDPCNARSRAIPPDHGARGFRAIRSFELCPETLDQRALSRRAQG